MSQPRRTKIFTATLLSIVVTAAALEFLHSSPVPAGAFSLSEFHRLGSVEKIISTTQTPSPNRWNRIEVSFTDTKEIASNQPSYHFMVYNNFIGGDGQIQPTSNWQNQVSAQNQKFHYDQTIRIGILLNNQNTIPSIFQIKRTEALVEALSEKFGISVKSIFFSDYWL